MRTIQKTLFANSKAVIEAANRDYPTNILYDRPVIVEKVITDGLGRFSVAFIVPSGVIGAHDVTDADQVDPSVEAGAEFTQTP